MYSGQNGIVAVVDSGVDSFAFGGLPVLEELEIEKSGTVKRRSPHHGVVTGHGSKCAAILHFLSPTASILSIKIVNEDTCRSTKEQLIQALRFCRDNGVRLINLSMGTVDYRDYSEVIQEVRTAVEAGVVVVAAYHNWNIYTCPASLPIVIGVKSACEEGLTGREYIVDGSTDRSGSNFIANSRFLLPNTKLPIMISCSNSFAAPVLTSAVYELMSQYPESDIKEIRRLLCKRAKNVVAGSVMAHCARVQPDTKTPMIAVCDCEGVGRLATALVKRFEKDGYTVLFCTDGKIGSNAIPMQYYMQPKEETIGLRTLSILCEVYHPDILLACLQRPANEGVARVLPFDKVIYVGNVAPFCENTAEQDKLLFYSEDYCGSKENMGLSFMTTLSNVDTVYKNLLHYYILENN